MGKNNPFLRKWRLALKILPVVGLIIALKFFLHSFGWEIISLNPLFSGIVAANVFLLGFLIAGVLADYKESEKLPGELASSIESIADECFSIYKSKKSVAAKECLEYALSLSESAKDWFHKKERTKSLMDKVNGLGEFFAMLEPLTQATFIARLKQEQSAIRRTLTRIHTIRETSFVSSGYTIAEAVTFLMIIGLLLVRMDPFYESLFFAGVISFLIIYMLALIKDLDNPFSYYEKGSGEDVSLKPLNDAMERIRAMKS